MRKFIIALCPASKIYLASVDPVFREGMNLGQATVGVPTLATKFNTFEAAMEVSKTITGWGGAQRVEEIAVDEIAVEDHPVIVSFEEIALAVRRTDCATVTLTDAQRERAAVLLADALRDLIDYHLPRLIGNAQHDAAAGA